MSAAIAVAPPPATTSGVVLPRPLDLGFALDAEHEAHEPPEVRGIARDGVRLLVSRRDDPPDHHVFTDLPSLLDPGDLLVVNTSGTVPAAADATLADGRRIVVHLSTQLPAGLWMVEPRTPQPNGATTPLRLDADRSTVHLVDGTVVELLRRAPGSHRLWLAATDDDVDLLARVSAMGRPIRYGYVRRDWGLGHYQTVFAEHPGSAEMPSAARPFTPPVVAALVRRGIGVVPITLHTGVSSLEGHELPYPERYRVPAATAATVNATRTGGGRVVAVGTTVVRALETTIDAGGLVHPGEGWTDVVVTPARGATAVDGLLTGWHEPEATHLAMLEAVAGRTPLELAYREAFAAGYLWHEFGDSHLLLPGGGARSGSGGGSPVRRRGTTDASEVVVPPPVPSGRRSVLRALRLLGDATAEEVATDLGITVSGARQQLRALHDEGLVATTELPPAGGGRGRRRLVYHVAEAADPLFPKAYGALTNELLGYLDDDATGAVDRLFERRRDTRIAAAHARLAGHRSLGAKVRELASILDEDGYLATAEQVGRDHHRLVEHNCAIASVARRYGQACASELDFIRTVLPGAEVTRVSHMVEGARHCAYDIRRRRTA